MFRVTSLTSMDDRQLNRWIKRLALLLVVGGVLFTAFYFFDRWRAPSTPIVDRQLAALEQAVRDNPEDITSRGLLADTYVTKGRYEDAIAQYNLILDAGKEEELAKYGRAAAYTGLEQYDLAAKDYERVVEIASTGEMANVDPMLEASYYQLGSIALKQERPAQAIAHLEKALAINRADADALYLIGTAYIATGETTKAETALRAAVAFDPLWNQPYVALARAYSGGGKPAMAEWAGAMADFTAGKPELGEPRLMALADDPVAGIDAAIGLGLLHEKSGDLAGAAEWYGRALEQDPENAAARLGLGRAGSGPGQTALPALPTPGAPAGSDN